MEDIYYSAKTDAKTSTSWQGKICRIHRLSDHSYSCDVNARGSYFHMIIGKSEYGNYLCIPNWNVGSEMGALSDLFWNSERLLQYTALKKSGCIQCSVCISRTCKIYKIIKLCNRWKYLLAVVPVEMTEY